VEIPPVFVAFTQFSTVFNTFQQAFNRLSTEVLCAPCESRVFRIGSFRHFSQKTQTACKKTLQAACVGKIIRRMYEESI
jgi:hypothetical protein